mmetsp:Transcript_2755/g.4276  ORF Transcript_2755/g.4276 Transcript_2755/m.4276 type:complete len:101 (+) Transcript_2755:490-792(+)
MSLRRQHSVVKKRFGDSFKPYGRDHGGYRESRRNFLEQTEYTDPEDDTKRTRVRFNLDGLYGSAFVFAEVSKDTPSGNFVIGRHIAIENNSWIGSKLFLI